MTVKEPAEIYVICVTFAPDETPRIMHTFLDKAKADEKLREHIRKTTGSAQWTLETWVDES